MTFVDRLAGYPEGCGDARPAPALLGGVGDGRTLEPVGLAPEGDDRGERIGGIVGEGERLERVRHASTVVDTPRRVNSS